jgi:predicted RNA-binding protein with EMAP domain
LDTAKDARILVLEDALHRLNEIVSNRKLKLHLDYSALDALLSKAGSLLYEVKYSYMDSNDLAQAPPTVKIVEIVEQFQELVDGALASGYVPNTKSQELALAEYKYARRVVNGFPDRLKRYDEDPAHAVDILAVEITKKQPVEVSENLQACRCTDGSRIWMIATNIQNVAPEMKLCCAVLPPVEMMGFISEAMFLGMNKLDEDVPLGALENVPPAALDQARSKVKEIVKRMM